MNFIFGCFIHNLGLGYVLYFILTGKHPFDFKSLSDMVMTYRDEPSLPSYKPELAGRLT